GVKREIPLTHPGPCQVCDGSGAENGRRTVCPRCKGAGQVAHARGPFLLQSICPSCQNASNTIEVPCKNCRESGQIKVERTVKVTFPANIDDNQTLRVPSQGLTGTQGGAAGHLYVDVAIEPDPRFQREGTDLLYGLEVSFPDAALGTEIEVPGLDDEAIKV